MNPYVLDASVVVKWVIEETWQVESRRYWSENLVLFAPDFLLIECASAIQKKVWRKEIRSEEGWQAYQILCAYERILLTSTHELIRPAYELSNQLLHPIYDCLYLALALQEGAEVVTADKKFYERIKSSPYSTRIVWIEDPPELLDD